MIRKGLLAGLGSGVVSADAQPVNRTTWLTTIVLGITFAIAGLHHGFFELLQGSRSTPGLMIASIGPDHARWEYGTDGAFTLIPNFLATGIAAMLVGLTIIGWCLFFLRRRFGPGGFLALFVLLTLVGGGIGHIVFFTVAWAYSTGIHGRLPRWARVLGPRVRRALQPLWWPALATSSILFLVALEVSVFGFMPGVTDPESILAGISIILLASLLTLNVAYVAAIARDLEAVPSVASGRATLR